MPISGAKGDSFVLAGWAKGDSAPLPEDDDQQRTFGVELTFNYTAEVEDPKDMAITFNPNTDGTNWQYAAAPIVAEEAYNSVTVTITYDYNVNSAYFDGIQLFKEVFANSYTYDEDGNVISVENLQQQKTQYEYNANDELTKAILPTGAEVTYTYDDYHNVKTTTTAEGQTYRFEYDHYGNNTKVSITSGGQTVSSTATYTANGNYLASSTDALGNTTTYSYNADTGLLEWVQAPEDIYETEDTNQDDQLTDTRTKYQYDPQSLLLTGVNATTDTGLAMSASYTYTQDLLTKIQTPTTSYNFAYGTFNLRQSVTVGNGTTPLTLATYDYDDDNTDDGKATYLLERLDYGNGDGVQYSYDSYGRILSQTYEDGDTVSYLYDNDGAIAQLTDSASGITTRYYYDLSGRAAGYSVGQGDPHYVACIPCSSFIVSLRTGLGINTRLTYHYKRKSL